jgi:flagellar motility protein MotE (MotC chaperone)
MNKLITILTLLASILIPSYQELRAETKSDLLPPEGAATTVEERRIRSSIQKEVARLRQKEKMLEMKEMELKTLSREVDKKLSEMEETRIALNELLQEKRQLENEKAKALSKIYEKMDPPKAAKLLVSLDKDLAVTIIEGMNSKKAGKVLNNMEPKVAATLSKSYASLEER